MPHSTDPARMATARIGTAQALKIGDALKIGQALKKGDRSVYVGNVMKQATDRSTDWLCGAGLRPTRQRLALAHLLMGDGNDRHVTAESLFESAVETGEKVSLATVYNTLRAFCSVGLVREITVDGSKSYFDTNMTDHPHFYWEDSGTLTDAPSSELEIRRLPSAPAGAEVASVDVVIRLRRR